eukprot:1338482-Rhodomonas_salina.1
MWPAERMVAGFRVCQHVRLELLEHAESILLVKRAEVEVSEETVAADFCRMSDIPVVLKWRGRSTGLMCLASLNALTHLDFSPRPAKIGAEGAERLAGALKGCTSLTRLELRCNGMGAEGAGMLAQVLSACKALNRVDLGSNEIGAEGMGRLAVVLGECAKLAHLNLSDNGLGGEGTGRLAG